MVFFASVQGAAEAEKGFDISPPGGYNKQVFTCGVSTSVVRRLPKPNRRVRLPYPAPRRNGLRSIQKARSQDRAFLIPLCHSSFSPRNFALQTFAGAPAASRHVIASVISLAAAFVRSHRALFAPPPRQAAKHKRPLARVDFSKEKPRKKVLPGAFYSFRARSKRSSRLSLTVRRRAGRRGGRLSRSGRG